MGGEFQDKTIVCRDCGRDFVHTAAEQEFFRERGFMNEPKSCRECRHRRKSQRSERGPGGRDSYARRGPPGRSMSSPPPPPRAQPVPVPVGPTEESEGGETKIAICGRCGRDTQLAHTPSPLRPVYCRECYDEWRAESDAGETA